MELKVEVLDEVNEAMAKLNKKELLWVILKSDEKNEKCLLEATGESDSSFDKFRDALPDNEPR